MLHIYNGGTEDIKLIPGDPSYVGDVDKAVGVYEDGGKKYCGADDLADSYFETDFAVQIDGSPYYIVKDRANKLIFGLQHDIYDNMYGIEYSTLDSALNLTDNSFTPVLANTVINYALYGYYPVRTKEGHLAIAFYGRVLTGAMDIQLYIIILDKNMDLVSVTATGVYGDTPDSNNTHVWYLGGTNIMVMARWTGIPSAWKLLSFDYSTETITASIDWTLSLKDSVADPDSGVLHIFHTVGTDLELTTFDTDLTIVNNVTCPITYANFTISHSHMLPDGNILVSYLDGASPITINLAIIDPSDGTNVSLETGLSYSTSNNYIRSLFMFEDGTFLCDALIQQPDTYYHIYIILFNADLTVNDYMIAATGGNTHQTSLHVFSRDVFVVVTLESGPPYKYLWTVYDRDFTVLGSKSNNDSYLEGTIGDRNTDMYLGFYE